MTNNSELVKARNAMTTILAAMKIEVVLSIDDEYGAVGFSKIIKIVEDELLSRRDWIKDLFPQVNFESPAEVYTQDLQMEWDSLSQDKRRALYDLLAPNAPVGGPSSVLSQICPLNVREYTPSQWDASYDQVLQEITPGHFGLVLFDQNLEDDTNYTATGSNSGLGLAQRLLASSYSNKVICGVLSHMFDMQSEMIRWREWVSGHQLKPAAILPISKARLNINKPLQFVDAIKATVLNSHYEVLKTFMRSVLGTANGQALNYIDELNPYAFNHIVISSSRADGIWEFDTLLRLFRIYQKDEIHKAIIQNPNAIIDVNREIKFSQQISDVPTNNDDYMPHVWRLANHERFEPVETVAQTELQTGDIFIDPDLPKNKYILLAQPCDLAVRLEGDRALERQPVPLVPFEIASKKDLNKKPSSFWNTHAVIQYIDQEGELGCVKFQEVCWVNLDVLELSVFEPSSKCRYVRGFSVTLPTQLSDGYKKRLMQLNLNWKGRAERLHNLYMQLNPMEEKIRDDVWNSTLLYMPFQSIASEAESESNKKIRSPQMPFTLMRPVTYDDDKGIFDFHLERNGRYRGPGANRLLSAFSKYLSRDADEVDFGKENKEDYKS